ncbi:MAG TPA: PQQ-binding-like beta-propeller repeat protein, partial [Planctomycetaceae bacterium]|nr:PQQ-binding-like beta-propeller repeat protein [Planctomycetaceae bacterium]
DRVVLTCAIGGTNGVLCLDWNGKELWRQKIGSEKPGKSAKASGCNPSAVTDGKNIFVFFKSGDLACLDFSGKVLWQHNLHRMYGADTLWWDVGTSPVLTADYVVAAVMHSGPSYLVAFDKTSGKMAWKHDRNLDAPSEAAQSYTTPIVVIDGGREVIVVVGADHVTAHDAANGNELWRVSGLNPTGNGFFRSIASPVAADGIVVAPYARGGTLTAIRLGGSGDVTKSHIVWSKKLKSEADVPSPALVDGKVYVCGDRGRLSCFDLRTGDELWAGEVEKHRLAFSASPVVADGRIYLTREDGKTFVAEQGGRFKLLGANELTGELVVATPVFVNGRILIRTAERLYSIGNKSTSGETGGSR